MGAALRGPLVDAIARDIARYAVVERVVDELLAAGMADQLADRLLDGPELERIVTAALESPGVQRLVIGVVESPLIDRVLDTVVERLPESEEMWLLVDQIARSPAVTEAITQQSMGFADQVAGEVRIRSQRADAGMERVAQRLLRRKRIEPPPPEGDSG